MKIIVHKDVAYNNVINYENVLSSQEDEEGLKEIKRQAALKLFYQRPVATTSGYLARSIVNSVLKGAILHKVEESGGAKGGADYSCPVQ